MQGLTRKAVAALLTLGVALSTSGCSGTLHGPGIKPWTPPAMCLEPCPAIPEPEKLGLKEWHAQVLERYVECSVTHSLCTKDLLRGVP